MLGQPEAFSLGRGRPPRRVIGCRVRSDIRCPSLLPGCTVTPAHTSAVGVVYFAALRAGATDDEPFA